MKVLVCVKQVPDIEQISVSAGNDGEALLGELTEYRMNRFDEFAVESALRLQEAVPQELPVCIDVLTVGPERSQEVVRRSLGMGARKGIHLKTDEDAYLGPAVIAAGIARYAKGKDYALILTGSMSEDGMHGLVGPMVAGHLKLPCAIYAVQMALAKENTFLYIEKELDGGIHERLRLKLPAVVTVQSGINRPRYPALSKLLRANAQELNTIELSDLRPAPIHATFQGTMFPHRSRAAKVLTGTPLEKAEALVAVLQERALLH